MAVFRLGDVTLDSSRNEVSGPAGRVHLQPRVADFAAFLSRRADELVTREELIEAVWHGYPGADQSLTNAAAKLREALEEAGGDREQLQTVPKRGYRLVGQVEVVETGGHRPSRRRLAAAGALGGALLVLVAIVGGLYWPFGETEARPRLVVLPLENLGPSDNRYLALGLTEEITTRLASVENVDVISRTSAMQYADGDESVSTIADELGVDYLLEGSVQWQDEAGDAPGRIRIAAQLIRAEDDTHLWANMYDRPLQDVFKVQERIAGAVVDALEVKLVNPEPRVHGGTTDSIEAYELYLAGKQAMHQRGHWYLFNERAPRDPEPYRKIIELFERAVAIDPGFAPAWAAIANAYSRRPDWWLENYMDREAVGARALKAARRAVELDPGLAEAHASLGAALERFADESAQARVHLKKAIELNPHHAGAHGWLAGHYRNAGRLSDALPLLERAATLDPLNRIPVKMYARTLAAMGRYDEAVAEMRRLHEYRPETVKHWRTPFTLAFESGRFVEAHYLRRSGRTEPSESRVNDEETGCCDDNDLFARVRVDVTLGRFDAARSWLAELRETAPESNLLRIAGKIWLLNGTGQYQRLQMYGKSLLDLDWPTSLTNRALNGHGRASLLVGDVDSAIRSLESAGNWTNWRARTATQGLLAYAYLQADRPEAARDLATETLALLEETESYGNRRPVVFFRQAVMLAMLDRKEEAFEALDEAYEWGWRHYHQPDTFRPLLDQLIGDDPRYTAFIERVLADLEAMRAAVESESSRT